MVWQATFTNSTEVLFAVLTFYQLRVVERLWGSRKFASFLVATLPYTTLLPPLLLTFVLRPLSFGKLNYLPAGPTPVLFALLANYYAAIPYTYRYKISPWAANTTTSPSSSSSQPLYARSLTLTSKSLSYLPPLQLALSQFPGSCLAAAVGWGVGTAYRREMLPGATRWRVPGWMVGEEKKGGFEGLRARLDAEREREGGGVGLATGILAGETGGEERGARQRQRRTLGEVVAEQFRGRG
ncbi:uba domain-containing ucp14 [Pyrenophora seminiperda CCB06]|uniref:Uba domain-containing ucp14 n=1 Tax=Pyrenophora seminiperda CCB06 TaxID=1302712 RepID=A0A3M7LZQ8_9PLEO|nr:uba domain-containing ucp14 [Pyrenophora seminiperda CCB06]